MFIYVLGALESAERLLLMEQASPRESTRTKSFPIVESIRHWYSIWDLKEDGNEQREACRCGEPNNRAFFSPVPPRPPQRTWSSSGAPAGETMTV